MARWPLPVKRLSQNFLTDPGVIQSIIDAVALNMNQPLLEIGPGRGALTQVLLELNPESFTVIEIDRRLAQSLHARYGDRVQVICDDILKIDIEALNPGNHGIQVVGNLPYHLSTPILIQCLEALDHIESMYFMLQKEVAERISAAPGSKQYGRLSVRTQVVCEAQLGLIIPPEAFDPKPKVESAMIHLRPHPTIPPIQFESLDRLLIEAFSKRRKQLGNALKPLLTVPEIESTGVDPSLRPECVSVDEFVRLSECLALKR
ncbi:MAG: 16S rRNA (adenine(1518)-N(6)/adenine(1519)-N(6))-dimethyltransferase [Legionellales bacterium]|nr:16S rRNA (adenine(1518)-N(6)/adenine(1519)-N(6))-dimethyltransferase [Legionellales bacterium]|tara:strand:+ start:51 stop:833 length:783 start_codon:yes stop_codon:yes gene_type:complete